MLDRLFCLLGMDLPVHRSRMKYISNRESVTQGTKYYYFDLKNLQNPLLIDGEIVHPSNLSDSDRQILDVMKKRDASTSQEEIEKLSQQLYTLAAGSCTDLDISKPFAYYEMGRNSTESKHRNHANGEIMYASFPKESKRTKKLPTLPVSEENLDVMVWKSFLASYPSFFYRDTSL